MDREKDTNAISTASVASSQVPLSLVTRTIGHNDYNHNRGDSQPNPSQPIRVHSEHGHDLTKIQPLAKHSGNSVATFFNGLFTTIIALGTLGTSITFTFVLQNPQSPPSDGARFDANAVQFFLALSWLLFLLALATASLGSTLLTFFKKHWVNDWDGLHGRRSQLSVQLYAVSISGLMGALLIAAFILMCLVVVAYQPTIGWLSLGFTSLFGVVVLVSILNQVPWPWIQPRSAAKKGDEKDSLA